MPMINIAITGASGRMGRALVQAVSQSEGLRLTGATERAGSAASARMPASSPVSDVSAS